MNDRELARYEDAFGYLRDAVSTTQHPAALLLAMLSCAAERFRQDAKWGDQSDQHLGGWFSILAEEFGEVAKEVCEMTFARTKERREQIGANLRAELVQTMASCAAIIEAGDRLGWDNWPVVHHLKHTKDENTS